MLDNVEQPLPGAGFAYLITAEAGDGSEGIGLLDPRRKEQLPREPLPLTCERGRATSAKLGLRTSRRLTMLHHRPRPRSIALAALVLGAALAATGSARAHCDTLDGPVVADARTALAASNVTPVLKWVRPGDEPEIRTAFARTLAARAAGDAARELADTWFFETLVRVHRAGEGAPYTGLKPSGTEVDPAVRLADRALEGDGVEALVGGVTAHVAEGLRDRFREAAELRKHAGDSVDAGRAYVAAYVDFVHYAERLHQAAVAAPGAHGEAAGSAGEHAH